MPRRKRLVVKTPHGHWQTMIFIASLRVDRIAAPCVLDGLVAGDRRGAEIALQPPLFSSALLLTEFGIPFLHFE
jgi:hypothetical protein